MDEKYERIKTLERPVLETVIVSVFGGKLTFCLPKDDWDFMVDSLFGGNTPTVRALSKEVARRTGVSAKDVGSWHSIANLLHDSIERERQESHSEVSLFSFVEEEPMEPVYD